MSCLLVDEYFSLDLKKYMFCLECVFGRRFDFRPVSNGPDCGKNAESTYLYITSLHTALRFAFVSREMIITEKVSIDSGNCRLVPQPANINSK